MKKLLVFILTLTSLQVVAQEILIFGGQGNKDFLGCLTCNEYDSNSVWNDMSQYGWDNGFGKWNPFGPYKNPYSLTSACNSYSSSGPVLVDRQGNFYGRLTVNDYADRSICGMAGNEKICRALKVMCAK
jgi:hypothetical protein